MKGLFFVMLIAVALAGTTAASAIEWQKFDCNDPAWVMPPFSPRYCETLRDFQDALKLNEEMVNKSEAILKQIDQDFKREQYERAKQK